MTDTNQQLTELTEASGLYETYLDLAELAVEALPETEGINPEPPKTDLSLGLVVTG